MQNVPGLLFHILAKVKINHTKHYFQLKLFKTWFLWIKSVLFFYKCKMDEWNFNFKLEANNNNNNHK